MRRRQGSGVLAALLDGPCRRLRDTNHVDPHRIPLWDPQRQPVILVWDQTRQPVNQAVTILELLGRYPRGDAEEARWCAGDLHEILQRKRDPLRMSLVAHDLVDEREDAEPTCGTVVLSRVLPR